MRSILLLPLFARCLDTYTGCIYKAHVCFYVCWCNCMGVCGYVCCVATVGVLKYEGCDGCCVLMFVL